MLRSPCELSTRPRLKLSPVLGAFRIGVLVTLKNSVRNSNLLDSLIGNSFWTLRFPERSADGAGGRRQQQRGGAEDGVAAALVKGGVATIAGDAQSTRVCARAAVEVE